MSVGPFTILLHSPVRHLQDDMNILLETVSACLFYQMLNIDRAHLNLLRDTWRQLLAQGRARSWHDLIARDIQIAESILADPSRDSFFLGMRKRLLLRCVLLELNVLVFQQCKPLRPSPGPSRSPSSNSPTPEPSSPSVPLLDPKQSSV